MEENIKLLFEKIDQHWKWSVVIFTITAVWLLNYFNIVYFVEPTKLHESDWFYPVVFLFLLSLITLCQKLVPPVVTTFQKLVSMTLRLKTNVFVKINKTKCSTNVAPANLRNWWALRLAKAFPGARAPIELTKPADIKRALKVIFDGPLTNNSYKPLLLTRGSCSIHINEAQIKRIKKNHVQLKLLSGHETHLNISRVIYLCKPQGRDWHKHIYIETLGSPPTKISNAGELEEKYYFRGWETLFLRKEISIHHIDDGHFNLLGFLIAIKGREQIINTSPKKTNYLVTTYWHDREIDEDKLERILNKMLITPDYSDLNNYLTNITKPDNRDLN